jgi:hypothetical protein
MKKTGYSIVPHSNFLILSHQQHPAGNGLTLHEAGVIMNEAHDIAECFASEFCKNFFNDYTPTGPSNYFDQLTNTSPSIDCINVDVDTVCLILTNQRSSAAGPDGIPGIFYKRLAHELSYPMTIIFQQSLHQRCIPDMWRKAIVISLYKGKGGRTCASSYRPISLTDIASKCLERLIADQIRKFLNLHSLIHNGQHGFRDKRSTVSNLLICDSLIANSFNNEEPYDVMLLDFARACDKVLHSVFC